MRNFLVHFVLHILFKLTGNWSRRNTFGIREIFGKNSVSHEARKRKWDKALLRVWHDKDLLDFLFYQAESDKENSWLGKIPKQITQGARARTLFLVYSAHMAYLNNHRRKAKTAQETQEVEEEVNRVKINYKKTVDIE